MEFLYCRSLISDYPGFKILYKMLHVIGLGLGDATDITVKGLEIIRMSDRVYLESYTSILSIDLKDLVGRL